MSLRTSKSVRVWLCQGFECIKGKEQKQNTIICKERQQQQQQQQQQIIYFFIALLIRNVSVHNMFLSTVYSIFLSRDCTIIIKKLDSPQKAYARFNKMETHKRLKKKKKRSLLAQKHSLQFAG